MILRGEAPPPEWVPHIKFLDFSGESTFVNAEPLRELVNLTGLSLSDTQITSAEPLKGLVNLTKVYLSNTQITSAKHLKGLVNLTRLALHNTKITSAEPLKGLVNLEEVYIDNTPITDISPLRALPRLARIDVGSRKRAKAMLPQLGEGWYIPRKYRLNSWYELRREVPGVNV